MSKESTSPPQKRKASSSPAPSPVSKRSSKPATKIDPQASSTPSVPITLSDGSTTAPESTNDRFSSPPLSEQTPFTITTRSAPSGSLTATAPLPAFTFTTFESYAESPPQNHSSPSALDLDYPSNSNDNLEPEAFTPIEDINPNLTKIIINFDDGYDMQLFLPPNWHLLDSSPDPWQDDDKDKPTAAWTWPTCPDCGIDTRVTGYCGVCIRELEESLKILPNLKLERLGYYRDRDRVVEEEQDEEEDDEEWEEEMEEEEGQNEDGGEGAGEEQL
ncbi:hypothetical protein BJ508DRAFT_307238 [Ascobolus immersus RN42]|uniref:Uncharacterized protein n=1 Tax=Ascobolus immersus RN42 TaxID=1160509 RepID=A0A3N4IG01_ASCIM|nr:hypothetical protein BJ508DRAFT_307238 [Ascobolus immersus RN42]